MKARRKFSREFKQTAIRQLAAGKMIGKGQARWVGGSDIRKQNQFIDQLFELR